MKKIAFLTLSLLLLCSCAKEKKQPVLIDKSAFERVYDGLPISLYTLQSEGGLTLQVTNFGGRVVSLWAPDRAGNYADVVLGHNTIADYLEPVGERFLGAIVGRYANRIANGQFTIDGENYQLPINNNGQTLHGGLHGLDRVVWNVEQVSNNQLSLSYTSPDGDEGFPGELTIHMTYTVTPENEFKITYKATTDKPTVVNLSHHSFFNLKGEGEGLITDHLLTIPADYIVPVNEVQIPTGELMPVAGTPFDFRELTAIGSRIDLEEEQLQLGGGYDHCWVINRERGEGVVLNARVEEPSTGRVLEVYSDQPGIQFYSGNSFDGTGAGKNGKPHLPRASFALETQHFPDSPNQPNFPSTRLNPGEVYTQECIYKFSVTKK